MIEIPIVSGVSIQKFARYFILVILYKIYVIKAMPARDAVREIAMISPANIL